MISSTHGIRGEVKVFPTTDDKERYLDLKKVLLDTGKEQIPLEIQNVRFFKQMVILKFKGIDHIMILNVIRGVRCLLQGNMRSRLRQMNIILRT